MTPLDTYLNWTESDQYAQNKSSSSPSFSKLRLLSASWSAFLWYSVNLCCNMILSFSSRDTLASAPFLRLACSRESQSSSDVAGRKQVVMWFREFEDVFDQNSNFNSNWVFFFFFLKTFLHFAWWKRRSKCHKLHLRTHFKAFHLFI